MKQGQHAHLLTISKSSNTFSNDSKGEQTILMFNFLLFNYIQVMIVILVKVMTYEICGIGHS